MPLPDDFLNMTVYSAGASAVVAALCDVLCIPKIIDSTVTWDPAQCHLSPGLRVKAMLINILVHRSALWRVERFFEHQDTKILFGHDQVVTAGDLNDDALARALDKLAAVNKQLLFSSISLQAALTHDVSLSQLHCDTHLITPQKQKLDHPTARVILDMLSEITVIAVNNERAIINKPGAEILRLIRLAGFHEGVYLSPFVSSG